MPQKTLNEFKTIYPHGIYNPKKTMCINFDGYTVQVLRTLKNNKIITSYSETVRELVRYALPYFFGLRKIIKLIGEQELNSFIFEEPTKNKVSKQNLEQLREIYPELPEYKFMNEE